MVKILAYFQTENDAEAASAKLQKLKITNLIIDKIPQDAMRVPLIPAVNTGLNGAGGNGPTDLATPGIIGKKRTGLSINESVQVTHLIEFEIDENEVHLAYEELRNTKAYVEESLFSEE